jgi:hypothetical protein
MIMHPHHKVLLPPGSRLGYHEAPHEAVARVLKEEMGLDRQEIEFWPKEAWKRSDRVEIVQPPFQVQVERRKQRLGIAEHYDFVYVCTIDGVKPPLQSMLNPQWKSIQDLKQLRNEDRPEKPFSDVVPTYEKIIDSRF